MTRQKRGFIAMVIFILIVAASGYALAVSGNMRNPFTVVSEISNLVNSADGNAPTNGEFRVAQARANDGSAPSAPQGNFEARGSGEQTTIQWSQFGSVVFNLWFLAATAAFVMVADRILGFASKPLYRVMRRQRVRVAIL